MNTYLYMVSCRFFTSSIKPVIYIIYLYYYYILLIILWELYNENSRINVIHPAGFEPAIVNLEGYCSIPIKLRVLIINV